jgi:hypothetical protein
VVIKIVAMFDGICARFLVRAWHRDANARTAVLQHNFGADGISFHLFYFTKNPFPADMGYPYSRFHICYRIDRVEVFTYSALDTIAPNPSSGRSRQEL